MDRQREQRINLTREEIKGMIKDLEPGTMLTLEMSLMKTIMTGKKEVNNRWQINMN